MLLLGLRLNGPLRHVWSPGSLWSRHAFRGPRKPLFEKIGSYILSYLSSHFFFDWTNTTNQIVWPFLLANLHYSLVLSLIWFLVRISELLALLVLVEYFTLVFCCTKFCNLSQKWTNRLLRLLDFRCWYGSWFSWYRHWYIRFDGLIKYCGVDYLIFLSQHYRLILSIMDETNVTLKSRIDTYLVDYPICCCFDFFWSTWPELLVAIIEAVIWYMDWLRFDRLDGLLFLNNHWISHSTKVYCWFLQLLLISKGPFCWEACRQLPIWWLTRSLREVL